MIWTFSYNLSYHIIFSIMQGVLFEILFLKTYFWKSRVSFRRREYARSSGFDQTSWGEGESNLVVDDIFFFFFCCSPIDFFNSFPADAEKHLKCCLKTIKYNAHLIIKEKLYLLVVFCYNLQNNNYFRFLKFWQIIVLIRRDCFQPWP